MSLPTCLRSRCRDPSAFAWGLCAAVLIAGTAAAEPRPAAAGFRSQRIAAGLVEPTAMAFAPDGRLFVCEQAGALRVVKGGVLLAEPFLALEVSSAGERGLLGIAFDPDFGANGHLYLHFTRPSDPAHNRVSRFTADGDRVAPESELPILDLDPLGAATRHNGGAIHFGPDGMLYVATGDNADPANSQTLSNRHGKLLRLRRDGTIPDDNPFYDEAEGDRRAIWALGLRNPFTFDIQRGTGLLFVNDVGEHAWEEIHRGAPGANYGWPELEGPGDDVRFEAPVHAYAHGGSGAGRRAIAGGAFYDPDTLQFPAGYEGDYFFSDYVGGWIRRRDGASGAVSLFADGLATPVDLKVGPDGALYCLDHGAGAVYRFSYSAAPLLRKLRLEPRVLRGGKRGRGRVLFSAPLPRAATVQLSSSDRKRATVPRKARAEAGRRGLVFRIATRRLKSPLEVAIRARLGATARSAILRIRP